METFSEFIVKADTPDEFRIHMWYAADDLSAALILLDRKLTHAGFPSFRLIDKQGVRRKLTDTEISLRLKKENRLLVHDVFRTDENAKELILTCGWMEKRSPFLVDRIIIDLTMSARINRVLSKSINIFIRSVVENEALMRLWYECNNDRGSPFDDIEKALKMRWIKPPHCVLVDAGFMASRGGEAAWRDRGFQVTPVSSGFLLEFDPGFSLTHDEFCIRFSEALVEIHEPVGPSNAAQTVDILQVEELSRQQVNEYLSAYLSKFGRHRTTKEREDSRPFEYHRLDKDLINPNIVPESRFKEILRIYERCTQQLIKSGQFDYHGKGKRLIAYKKAVDAIWCISIDLWQIDFQHHRDSATYCRAQVSIGSYSPSLSRRRKPIPTDRNGNLLVDPQTFVWMECLDTQGGGRIDSRGLEIAGRDESQWLAFRIDSDEAVADSFAKLLTIWQTNFERASRLSSGAH